VGAGPRRAADAAAPARVLRPAPPRSSSRGPPSAGAGSATAAAPTPATRSRTRSPALLLLPGDTTRGVGRPPVGGVRPVPLLRRGVVGADAAGRLAGHLVVVAHELDSRWRRSISRRMYHSAFRRSSTASPF